MSSRKKLKKYINESMDSLYTDCVLYKAFAKEPNVEKADQLIQEVIEVHTELLRRANVTEGKEVKDRVKNYYKKLREDLREKTNDISARIGNLD